MCSNRIEGPKSLQKMLKPLCETLISKYAKILDFETVMCILQNIDNKNPLLSTAQRKIHEETTILHWASEHGQTSIVQYICKFVEEKNPHDIWGVTPLHLAAENGHLDIVRHLMEFCEDKKPKSYGVNTPLDMAARSGDLETFKYLLTFADYRDLRANNGEYVFW